MNLEKSSTWTRCGHSKLCNVLHASEFAQRNGEGGRGLIAVSLHPGTVKTGLSARPRASTPLYKLIQPLVEWSALGPEAGCGNILWCAASAEFGELVEAERGINGSYFEPIGRRGGESKCAKDGEMAEKLWGWSEGVLRRDGFLD